MTGKETAREHAPSHRPAVLDDVGVGAALTAVALLRIFLDRTEEEPHETFRSALDSLCDWLKTQEYGKDAVILLLHQLARHAASGAIRAYGGVEAAQIELNALEEHEHQQEHGPGPVVSRLTRFYIRQGTEPAALAPADRVIRNLLFEKTVDAYVRPDSRFKDACALVLCASSTAALILSAVAERKGEDIASHLEQHVAFLLQLTGPMVPDHPGHLENTVTHSPHTATSLQATQDGITDGASTGIRSSERPDGGGPG